tara:strand:- start:221 stop:490 length:270 start_codon:yes stop_codon:yes gene_type:complete
MPVLPLSKLITKANRILKKNKPKNQGLSRRLKNQLDTILTYKKYKMKPNESTVTRLNNLISSAENNPHYWPKGKMPKKPLKHRYRGQKD